METTGMPNATDWQKEGTGKSDQDSQVNDDHKEAPLESLSELTGFPIEFIKKELLLDGENISMGDLRQSIVRYLESTAGDLQNGTADD